MKWDTDGRFSRYFDQVHPKLIKSYTITFPSAAHDTSPQLTLRDKILTQVNKLSLELEM